MSMLKFKQRVVLSNYLTKIAESVENPITYTVAAKRATKDLGFPVSYDNVRTIIKDAEIPWKIAARGQTKKSKAKTLAQQLTQRVEALEAEVQRLRAENVRMGTTFGHRITALEEKNVAMWKQLANGGFAVQTDMFPEKGSARQ